MRLGNVYVESIIPHSNSIEDIITKIDVQDIKNSVHRRLAFHGFPTYEYYERLDTEVHKLTECFRAKGYQIFDSRYRDNKVLELENEIADLKKENKKLRRNISQLQRKLNNV